MQLTPRPRRRVDPTAPARRVDFKEVVWWLAEMTLSGESLSARQISDRFGCSRSAAYRWIAWLKKKRTRLRPVSAGRA